MGTLEIISTVIVNITLLIIAIVIIADCFKSSRKLNKLTKELKKIEEFEFKKKPYEDYRVKILGEFENKNEGGKNNV